ncbi:unnamed protein product [Spirodela intermedia]|uniref:[RNA-polymerase]-subunit kinase n=1 Tax=Spirodela intermedia TaxID=51605 RepID=A0A7I8J017_SPIIN|nr:unnamed protein product [Spirodela intermedia]CAA6663468.1 unnamed protein product [Spirodela intermedia]
MVPRRADSFEKIVKGRDLQQRIQGQRQLDGEDCGPEKVRFDSLEPESVKFMAREILILRRLTMLLAEKPIMPGRTEVEQLHRIFKLCGSPPEEYWRKSKLPHATIFKPQQPYKRCIAETFKHFPKSSLPLIETLLAIDPAERQTATAALKSEFFTTEPYACDPSSLPQYPPSKEMDVKLRDEEARRFGAIPAPDANAELQVNVDRRRMITHANAKSKSEKFPPPHQDGALGFPLNPPASWTPTTPLRPPSQR